VSNSTREIERTGPITTLRLNRPERRTSIERLLVGRESR